ncbi:Aste57867_14022 [Aphanomyces stellatus]|uniref:Protein SERAC1 n=1 Tax=Aphanomyces stellatus TaxID=120398 RepID=A0A485L0B2_9STRA|nr:hypothetical protein As57867_013971 [Aphanomyces stellatus]VFT90852.1 Aste57867_14022 [Aphanomyces stellatus]
MMHTRRLLGTVVGVAGASVVSSWIYYPEEVVQASAPPKEKRRRTFDMSAVVPHNTSTRPYGLEQSAFRDLGDFLASATVTASQAYMTWLSSQKPQHASPLSSEHNPFADLVDSDDDVSSKAAKRIIDSTDFNLLLNVLAGDTRNALPDEMYSAINRLATNVDCAAAIAERATRYGKKALLHMAKRHDMDPRLGDALRALTVLDGNECRFGPANLSSLVALACTPNLPAPYAEFAFWALAASASNKSLTSSYRLRKEWLGDDRVARTRAVLMRNPYIWSALLATRDATQPDDMLLQLQAARLVRELCAGGVPFGDDDERLDLVLHWFDAGAVPVCAEALSILTTIAAADDGVRAKLLARGVLDALHAKIESNQDTRLTALLLGAVHALAFHHAASLDARALTSVAHDRHHHHHSDDYGDLGDFGEPTTVRGWIDLFTSFVSHDDADIAAHAVACLEALSTHGAYRNQGMQEWIIAVLDSVLEHVPADVARQASTVRAARSRTRPLKSERQQSAAEFVAAHTRALRALAFVLDRPDCQDAFVRTGGLPLLRAMFEQSCDDDGGAATPTMIKFQQEWARAVANLLSLPTRNAATELATPFWAAALAQLATSPDLQVETQARRALHNLRDTRSGVVYREGVHPFTTDDDGADVDVVFVHGLLGCAYETWIAGDDATRVWAHDWLVRDLAAQHLRPRVLSLSYDSKLFAAESSFATLCLDDTSSDLLAKLRAARVGVDRPVVFVTHSMGGIVVKKMLQDDADETLARQTKGLVFYGVPHHGSPVAAAIFPVASVVQRQGIHFQHPVTADLHGTPRLEQLNDWCAAFVQANDVTVLSIGEGAPVKLPLVGFEALVVPEASSNPGFGAYVKMAEMDHMQVCKPTSMEDARYTLTRDVIAAVAATTTQHAAASNNDDDDA